MKNLPDWWEKVRFSRLEQKTEESPSVDDEAIDITEGRTEEFLTAAKDFSDYLKSLPLSHEQNDRLVEFAVRQTQEAERGAFLFGAEMALKLVHNGKMHREE